MAICAESFVPAGAVLPAGVYHRDIYFPDEIRALVPQVELSLRYTRHAEEAALTDRYGLIVLPEKLDLAEAQIVEVAAFCDRKLRLHAHKVLVRQAYKAALDLVLAVQICHGLDRVGLVKTAWLNMRNDHHRTLRPWAYVQPFF